MYEHRDDIQPEQPEPGSSERVRRGVMAGLVAAVVVALIAFIAGVVRDDGGDAQVRAASVPPTTTTTAAPAIQPGVTSPFETVPTTALGVVNQVNGTPRLASSSTTPATTA